MQPVLVVVSRTSSFSDEMDRLRSVCFPGSDPSRSSRDEFNSRSIYIVNEVRGKLAAYGRLTPGPRAVFELKHGLKELLKSQPDQTWLTSVVAWLRRSIAAWI
jgi:hypothetical protein